jgi:peptide/nickel transport system substrate-binding protein
MIEFVDNGYGRPTQTWFPESSYWNVDYAPFTMEANPERAKELIEEAGFSTPLDITILSSPDDPALSGVGQVLASNLSDAGFNPNLQELEIGTWVGRLSAREFDIAVDWSVSNLHPGNLQSGYDQENFPRALTPARGIYPELFEHWEEAAQVDSREERQQIYTDLQERLVDVSLNIPLYHRDLIEAHRNSVSDYNTHPHFLNWMRAVDTAGLEE